MTEFSIARQEAGLTVMEVAEIAGYTVRTIRRWEAGVTKPRKPVMDLIRSKTTLKSNGNTPIFTFIDLFAGIGGMRRGFESVGGKCIYTSEWNIYAQQTYRENYECDHEIAGDITLVNEKDIPTHEHTSCWIPVSAVLHCRCFEKERSQYAAWVPLRNARNSIF